MLLATLVAAQLAGAAPAPRNQPAAAWDASRGVLVLFGGRDAEGHLLGDTWEHDGARWRRREVPGPAARGSHALVYDPVRRQVLLFGGSTAERRLGDLWSWDGRRWRRLAARGPAPTPRDAHAMAFDETRRVLLIFGGLGDGDRFLDDTWAWDGRAWRQRASGGPGGRFHAAMADDGGGHVVLFGGRTRLGRPGESSGETWRWDGRGWTRLAVDGPSPRDHAMFALDRARGRLVLVGGAPGLDETWEWDRERWTRLDAAPRPGRAKPALAWDGRRVLLFGGSWRDAYYQDLWAWDGSAWTRL